MHTLKTIYQEMRLAFTEQGIDTPDLDAKILIKDVLEVSEEDFILDPHRELKEEHCNILGSYKVRRLNHEPVAKIIGRKEFWGREFKVNDHTLDPRPDSETLIESVLGYVKSNKYGEVPLKILDLGTGSGCLLITLLAELANSHGVAIDISGEALSIAKQNAALNGVEDRFIAQLGSWTEGVDLSEFDIIISNPPYIPESEIRNLSPEVQNHDPILALVGGKSGLDCYEIIFNSIKNEKNFKGHAFFEIGFDQHSDIMRLVDDSMLQHCDSVKDLGGNMRVVEICRGDK